MTTPPLHGHHHGPPSDELAELEQRDVAVAFVDLAGYSVFTEFCGDQEAAELAIRLASQTWQAGSTTGHAAGQGHRRCGDAHRRRPPK
ncbi:hypothetical protein [Gordonia jacobaea]|uniref:hypothetical protein n=1 Tax=Gordonia jacobaea TaxID=122202 RepID=UPI003D74EA2E